MLRTSRTSLRRILFVIDELIGIAGTEKHIYQLCTGLASRGFDCRVVGFRTTEHMVEMFARGGIVVRPLALERMYGPDAVVKFLNLVGFIKSFRPDIVQTFHFKADTFGVAAAKLAGVRYIVSSRRDMGDLKKGRQILLNRIMNPFIDHMIAVCNRVKANLVVLEGVEQNRITTIYNGLESTQYDYGAKAREKARSILGIDRASFVVGTACIFRPEKDVMLLLRAIDELRVRVPNLFALLVGDGAEMGELRKYVESRSMQCMVRFAGKLEDIRTHIQAMDVVCLTPSVNEGLSNAILEYMASGKPVVATDVGGNAELVVEGRTGFVIESGSVDALVDRIWQLYKDPTLVADMGASARDVVETSFGVDKMLDRTIKVYTEVLQAH